MTAQKTLRRKTQSLLASGVAALIAVSGLVAAPTAAFADAAPTITLSKTVLNPAGDTLTVTGSGFDTSAKGLAAYYGCGASSADAAKGFYVQVGWIKDTWRPSTGGANNTDRKGGPNTWFADDLNCIAPDVWTVAEDGTASFEYTFEVSEAALGALPEGARYAVFTNGAGGGTQAINEVSADITFEVPAPEVSASVTGASTTGLTVAASFTGATGIEIPAGQGMPGPSTGVYAALIEEGSSGSLSMGQQGVVAAFVPNAVITDGAGSATLNAAAAKLDRTKTYEVFFWYAHSNPTAETTIGSVPLTVTEAQWNAVFPPAPATSPFTDVKQGHKFYTQITWMYNAGLTTGVKQSNGTLKYLPSDSVSREAMAAFLYRLAGKPTFTAQAVSPFADLKTTDKFYKEITWLASEGITTGVKQSSGKPKFLPKDKVSREAMAAFIYRFEDTPTFAAPTVTPFADLKTTDKFYKEITWLADEGITTGVKQPSGKPKYLPKQNVSREAMAAFIYRLEN